MEFLRNSFTWKYIQDEQPEPNTEVVVFYLVSVNGEESYAAEYMHEKIISQLDSPIIYWIEKPS